MITNFDDFCRWMYVVMDDVGQYRAPRFGRPGPPPPWSDRELITMAIVGECPGWTLETEVISQ